MPNSFEILKAAIAAGAKTLQSLAVLERQVTDAEAGDCDHG